MKIKMFLINEWCMLVIRLIFNGFEWFAKHIYATEQWNLYKADTLGTLTSVRLMQGVRSKQVQINLTNKEA